MNDFNQQIITQFRANAGRVGGDFEGAALLLLHHREVPQFASYEAATTRTIPVVVLERR